MEEQNNLEIETPIENEKKYIFINTENIDCTFEEIVEDFKGILKSKAEIKFEHVETGRKNALDFQLAMSLAITISENQDKNYQYYIFSADRDFEIVTKYLENKTGKSVNLITQSQKDIINFIPKDLDNLGNFAFSSDKNI